MIKIPGAKDQSEEDIQRKIKQYENQLDKQLQKFNKSVAQNKSLREQIDALRRERVVFEQIYHKLIKELDQKKNEMGTVIEEAEAAYKKREQAEQEMKKLKKEAEEEQEEFQTEWNKLGKLIEEQ